MAGMTVLPAPPQPVVTNVNAEINASDKKRMLESFLPKQPESLTSRSKLNSYIGREVNRLQAETLQLGDCDGPHSQEPTRAIAPYRPTLVAGG
jgi:hypothetical protein